MGYRSVARAYATYAAKLVTGTKHPLFPPPWLHSIGGKNFEAVGRAFLDLFIEIGGLQPSDRVLDIGAGTGRMALPMVDYLTSGTYDGFEIVEPSVRWCQAAYADHPNFKFHHANVFSAHYNPQGVPASEYKFPFPDQSFDFIFLTSVFTHMLTDDVANYLREIKRVLAPDGRVFVTAYLLGREMPKPARTFSYQLNGCFSDHDVDPEQAIAYQERDFTQMVEDAGLAITEIHPGSWRGTNAREWQDILVLRA